MKRFVLLSFLALSGLLLSAQDYTTAVGLRAAWGFGATGKHFIKDQLAIEGIVNIRSQGVTGFRYTSFNITGLAEWHNDLSSTLDGLSWYYGGGAYVGFLSGDFGASDLNSSFIGIAGVIGLDLDLSATVPINLSLDWIPNINLAGGGGFNADYGGFAIRYIIE